jgi:aldehyde dehydrogenase (NAD+)
LLFGLYLIQELAMLETLDNGKVYAECLGADIQLVKQCYRYYAGWADKIHGKVVTPGGPFAKVITASTNAN